jgi:hypothetical protein
LKALGLASHNEAMNTNAVFTKPRAPRKAANSSQGLRALQAEEEVGQEEMLSWSDEAESGIVVPATRIWRFRQRMRQS